VGASGEAEQIRGQIRGSSLLLVGRLVALAVNLAAQVIVVRYLSKAGYGAFAYGLSIALVGQTIASFGLDRAISLFAPVYHERRDYPKLFGTIALVVGTILGVGLAVVAAVYVLHAVAGGSVTKDPQAASLLLVLILLAPVQALDATFSGLYAVFGRARAIFLRTYILAPLLRLAVVGLLVLTGSSVTFLAGGYVAAAVVGVAVYVPVLRQLVAEAAAHGASLRQIEVPAREILSLTIPLLTTSLVWVAIASTDAILLEWFRGTAEVGAFRAIQPAAELNLFVIFAFTPLFAPLAARLYARENRDALNDLYWQTAAWIAALSFPVLVVTALFAEPVTTTLYGSRYAESASYLAILAVGYYVQSALGFNGITLSVFRAVRYIVPLNVLAVLVNIGVNLALIPRYGALGAALGTCGTLLAHNLLKQAALRRATGLSFFDARYGAVYVLIGLGFGAVLAWTRLVTGDLALQLPVAAAVCAGVVAFSLRRLAVFETFPEAARLLATLRALAGGAQPSPGSRVE
jgi:O-antigen/teichoic acid export membrane protein